MSYTYLYYILFVVKVLIHFRDKTHECDDTILRSGISVILFNDRRNDVSLINSLDSSRTRVITDANVSET